MSKEDLLKKVNIETKRTSELVNIITSEEFKSLDAEGKIEVQGAILIRTIGQLSHVHAAIGQLDKEIGVDHNELLAKAKEQSQIKDQPKAITPEAQSKVIIP